jgi:hypothetical protein
MSAARPSHAARISSSPRLRALLTALLKAGDRGLTTKEIQVLTDACAVHSDVCELRANGYRIPCRMESDVALGPGQGRRRRFRYRLESNASSNAPSIQEQGALWPT